MSHDMPTPLNTDEILEDQNQEESEIDSTLESSTGTDADESEREDSNSNDSEDLEDQQDQEDQEEGNSNEDKGKKPNQNKNFKNLRDQLNKASSAKKALLDVLKIAQKNPDILKNLKLDEDGDLEDVSLNSKDYSNDIDGIFEGIAIPKFKKPSEYNSIEELFLDIRKGIFSSMLAVKERDNNQRTTVTRSFEKRLGVIKQDLKDDAVYDEFLNYASQQLKKPYIKQLGSNALDAILDSFNESRAGKKTNLNREISKKISQGKKPLSNSGNKGGSRMDYLRSKSMDDIITEKIGG